MRSLVFRFFVLVVALAMAAIVWVERAWCRRSPRYARALAWRKLDARLEALAPTRVDVEGGTGATYRASARAPFVDLERLPLRTPLEDGGVLHRFAGRAEWIAERRPFDRRGRRGAQRSVWLGLRIVGDEIHVEARTIRSILGPLSLFLAPTVLALFTTASLVVVVLSMPFTAAVVGLASLDTRSADERLARDALEEIEHALAEIEDATHDAPS